MLHQVTKPTPWRGGATLFRTLEEEAAEGARIGTNFQEWSMHGQVGERVQDPKKLEAFPPLLSQERPLRTR